MLYFWHVASGFRSHFHYSKFKLLDVAHTVKYL